MLSHQSLTRQEIGRAASYYEDSADDYFAKDGKASLWLGRGAEFLGLQGAVDSTRFRELLAGKISEDTYISRIATRKDHKTRIAIDLTFSAPKSVSLQALIAGDAALIAAHDEAVRRTLEIAEGLAEARTKLMGKTHVETTKNLVIAAFRHETSRARDPQLHTHAVVMNLTRRQDGQWRALRNDGIIKAVKYLGAVYRTELAHELQRQGFKLRQERDGFFELAHISREQLEAFSQRSAQVEAQLEKQGLTRQTATSAEKQRATLLSRSRKVSMERETLHRIWENQARELGIRFEDWNKEDLESSYEVNSNHLPAKEAAIRSIRYAILHLTERQSILFERDLIDVALKHAMGQAVLRDITFEIAQQTQSGFLIREAPLYHPASNWIKAQDNSLTRERWIMLLQEKGFEHHAAQTLVKEAIQTGRLVLGDIRYTTQTALEREKRILKIEADGREQLKPVMETAVADSILIHTRLNDGQRKAASLILTTENRIIGVQGFAGVGKSHMLQTVCRVMEAEGYKTFALAPYGSQVKALRELNISAKTLASFLRAAEKDLSQKTVLILDEAGVIPTRQMEQVFKLAEQAGARIVLLEPPRVSRRLRLTLR